jgi:chorismate mutase-like protein
MSRSLALLLLAILLSPAAWAQACTPGELFSLVAERLSYMPAVTEYKYARGLPVSDPLREETVLETAETQALELGIPPERVRPFVRAQIEVAKLIQRRLLQSWEEQGREPLPGGDDLIATIRPQLLRLGRLQLEAIQCMGSNGKGVESRHRVEFDAAISGANLPPNIVNVLFQSLLFKPRASSG